MQSSISRWLVHGESSGQAGLAATGLSLPGGPAVSARPAGTLTVGVVCASFFAAGFAHKL